MAVTVLLMSLFVERLWKVLPTSPYFDSLASLGLTVAIMLVGGVIAFLMVWTEFKVIQVLPRCQMGAHVWSCSHETSLCIKLFV